MAVGERVREAREASGMSQRALAARLDGFDASAICRIERGERKVSSDELYDIAEALGVTPGALLGVPARNGALVVAARLGAQARPEFLDHAVERVTQVVEMDDLLGRVAGPAPTPPARPLLEVPSSGTPASQGRALAAATRSALGLGNAPIGDLATLLEDRLGAHVVAQPIEGDVHGICVSDGTVAVILVNSNDHWARQRYTLAHELCHLLCGDLDLLEVTWAADQKGKQEKRADAFAAEFLAPAGAVDTLIGERAVDAPVVGELMAYFGLSFDAMCWRLLSLRRLGKNRVAALREGGARSAVAAAALTSAFDERARAAERVTRPPARLTRRAFDAYARGEVGVGVVAAVLGEPDLGVARRHLAEHGIQPAPVLSGADLV